MTGLDVVTDDRHLEPCLKPSVSHAAAAKVRQNQSTKPQAALGVLETVAINLAALRSTDRPRETARLRLRAKTNLKQ